jgi:hypothetical protein
MRAETRLEFTILKGTTFLHTKILGKRSVQPDKQTVRTLDGHHPQRIRMKTLEGPTAIILPKGLGYRKPKTSHLFRILGRAYLLSVARCFSGLRKRKKNETWSATVYQEAAERGSIHLCSSLRCGFAEWGRTGDLCACGLMSLCLFAR